ncbi:MAG: tagaturonate reductase, partial [Clostridiales bacterium]|nr:tagaturonate reductase [Clostridiales bacterium]
MERLSGKIHKTENRKIKILQFGEGNFLRAFADWIVQAMNDTGAYDGNVAVVQPIEAGRVNELKEQDGLYTLYLKGIDKEKTVRSRQVIDVLGDFINPYTEYGKFLAYAQNGDLEIVLSNTTESGIRLDKTDTDFTKCPRSFPGKLLAFLEARYKYFKGDFQKGLGIIPCELIDDNGAELKRVLTGLAESRGMGADFIEWLTKANRF